MRKVYTLSIQRVNLVALILLFPIIIIYALPFYLIWNVTPFTALKGLSFVYYIVFIAGGVVVHELLHGLTWALFAAKGMESIKFGIKWEYLAPYCHCTEKLKVWQYISGGLMPLFIMGILPAVIAMVSGNGLLMFLGIFFTWTSGGDIQAVWMLRKLGRNQHIYDHPDELGFIIEE